MSIKTRQLLAEFKHLKRRFAKEGGIEHLARLVELDKYLAISVDGWKRTYAGN